MTRYITGRGAPVSISLMALMASTAAAYAQTPTLTLDPITLTAGATSGYQGVASTTATGTATPLRWTPQSVQVVTGEVLKDQRAPSIAAALRNVSAAQGTDARQMPGWNSTLVRGFAADTYLDGMANYFNSGDPNAMANIDRIEVLKGPNGVLFGGGSGTPLGGMVNIVSKMPQDENAASITAQAGTHGQAGLSFDVNRSNGAGLAARMTGSLDKDPSQVKALGNRRYSLNPTVSWTNGDTTLTVQGRLTNWRQKDYPGLPATGTITGDFRLPRNLYIGNPDLPDSTARARSLTATLEHKLESGWTSTTQFRLGRSQYREYSQVVFGQTPKANAGPATWGLFNSIVAQDQTEASFSTRIAGEIDAGGATHKLVFGADYSRLTDKGAMFMDGTGTVDLRNPIWPAYVLPTTMAMSDGDNTYRTSGLFVQAQSEFGRLHVLSGLRLSRLEIDQISPRTGRNSLTRETKVLPRLGAVYDLNDQLSVFGGYSEGMKGNPFVFYAGKAKPEYSRQAEVGAKFDTGSGLSGSVAAFRIDRRNVPVTNPKDPMMATQIPEGRQRSTGLEADLVWQSHGPWKVIANYAYVDARLTADIPGGAKSGASLPGVPRQKGGVWVDYDKRDTDGQGWRAGAGLRRESSVWLDQANMWKLPGHTALDASASWTRGNIEFAVSGRNLTNAKYWTRLNYLGGTVAPGEGRQIGVSLTARF